MRCDISQFWQNLQRLLHEAVPTQKIEPYGHQPPKGLDHYLLYRVLPSQYQPTVVGLIDEFGAEPQGATVQMPIYFANPVEKTVGTVVTPIENKMAHLVFYGITATVTYPEVLIVNQLDTLPNDYYLTGPDSLVVPSAKLRFSELD